MHSVNDNNRMEWMEVKELSERMEVSEQVLKEAYRIHMADKKKFDKACKKYAEQCKRKRA